MESDKENLCHVSLDCDLGFYWFGKFTIKNYV